MMPRKVRTIKRVPLIDGVFQYAVDENRTGVLQPWSAGKDEPVEFLYVFDDPNTFKPLVPWLQGEWVKQNLKEYFEVIES